MKLFKEEITGLKTGLSKPGLIFFLFLFQEIILSQIPFKGFCKFDSLHVEPGLDHILSLNFDNNEYSDLFVYNPLFKNAELYSGINGTNFQLKRKFDLPVEISKMQPVILQNNMIESYAFTSRIDRTFGTLKFHDDGRLTIINRIKFDYYPENISVSYNQNQQDFEFLISGNSFYGISVITGRQNKLSEKKVTAKSVFKDAKFIDLNSDGNDDFVAINSIRNKIHFFFRNSKNDFEDLRQVDFDSDITSLQVFDFNYDGFQDILVGLNNGIMIFYGDATAAYNKTVKINCNYKVDKFVYGDFNRDGYFDLNYINEQNGIVSTIFAKDFFTFYPEMIHFRSTGIIDAIPFYSKFVNGIAYLNINGMVSILSKVNSLSEPQRLALAIKPSLISTFDYLNNGVKDIVFINDENNSLNFILRDASGLPDNLFTIELYEKHLKLKIAQISSEKKIFYLFSGDMQSVEALEVDFRAFSFKRKFYYSEGLIQDVLVKPDFKNDPEIFILYSAKGKLGLQVQTKVDENYFTKKYPNLETNWSNAHIISGTSRTIAYLQKSTTNLIYKSVNVDDKSYRTIFNVNLVFTRDPGSSEDYCSSDFSQNIFYGIFADSKKTGIFYNNEVYLVPGIENFPQFRITGKNHLFFGKNKSVFLSNDSDNSIYEINVDKKFSQVKPVQSLKDIILNQFIVEKLEPRSNNFIFTNTQNGFIEIR